MPFESDCALGRAVEQIRSFAFGRRQRLPKTFPDGPRLEATQQFPPSSTVKRAQNNLPLFWAYLMSKGVVSKVACNSHLESHPAKKEESERRKTLVTCYKINLAYPVYQVRSHAKKFMQIHQKTVLSGNSLAFSAPPTDSSWEGNGFHSIWIPAAKLHESEDGGEGGGRGLLLECHLVL